MKGLLRSPIISVEFKYRDKTIARCSLLFPSVQDNIFPYLSPYVTSYFILSRPCLLDLSNSISIFNKNSSCPISDQSGFLKLALESFGCDCGSLMTSLLCSITKCPRLVFVFYY